MLKDINAINFWEKSFGSDFMVTQYRFREALIPLLEMNKNIEYPKDFIHLVVERIFVPIDRSLRHSMVSQPGVQAAIDVFGPWINIFSIIYAKLFWRSYGTT